MSAVDRAVEKCRVIANYHVSPYRCYYFNPSSYSPVKLMKWAQKYTQNRMYMTLIQASKVMEMEPVPSELLMRHALRDGVSERMVSVGKMTFYLLKSSEMTTGLRRRYEEFKIKMASSLSKSLTLSRHSRKAAGNHGLSKKPE
ncbi:hypothetical protein CEB3_c17820 [Peptococcaceae bacterium CEB3]|nr:hypothetical protein CEB3_c17820 [Peptococcaceae bacterium CEB3]